MILRTGKQECRILDELVSKAAAYEKAAVTEEKDAERAVSLKRWLLSLISTA